MKLCSHRLPSLYRSGFTLLELLVVGGILIILMSLLAPAFRQIKGASDISNAAYAITGALERARNYAMTNNTYVWVGFYEEDLTASLPTSATPAYPGKGRLVLATVASRDGTRIFEDNEASAPLPTTRISQIGKLIKLDGLHVTDIGPPPFPPPSPAPAPNTVDGRPDLPYVEGSPFDHYNRVSSDSDDATKFSFSAQGYTFPKTIRFNPRGEANLNSTYGLKHVAEIGLRPTQGRTADISNKNVVAIQFGAMDGNFKIYRR